MDTTVFDVEFYSKVPDPDDELRLEAERQLEALRAGHTDMIGASVALEQPAHGETPYLHQARVVVYMRPDNIVAVEKDETAEGALKGALKAVERQVRERREKLGQHWKQPSEAADMSLYELTPRELYDAYGDQADLATLLDRGRVDIAKDLINQKELDPKIAYYVADQILKFAQTTLDSQQ